MWIDNLCISEAPAAATLAQVMAAEGEEGLLDLLDLEVDPDTASCQMAVALQLGSGFPAVDSLGIQLVGAETGTVYSEGPQVLANTSLGYGTLTAMVVSIPDVGIPGCSPSPSPSPI